MQPGNNPLTLPFPFSPLLLLNASGSAARDFGDGGFELSRYLVLGSLLFLREGGGMDLSKVGEKIISSVCSARSLGLLPSPSDRPEVPERTAAAAAAARVLVELPGDYSYHGSKPHLQDLDELEKEFYEEAARRLAQLERISEHLSRHVMEHHEELDMLELLPHLASYGMPCKTMMYLMRRPPKDFEALVVERFRKRGHYILKACDAYLKGHLIGSLTKEASVSEMSSTNDSNSVGFKLMLRKVLPKLFGVLSEVGAECRGFEHLNS